MIFNKIIRQLRLLTLGVCFLLLVQQMVAVPLSVNGAEIIQVVEPKEIRSNKVTPAVDEALQQSFYTIPREPDWSPIYYDGSSTSVEYSSIGSTGKLNSYSDTLDEFPYVVDSDLTTPDQPFSLDGWGEFPVPKAVKVDSDAPGSLYAAQYQATSLHYGYSLTFEAKGGQIPYPFLLDLTGPTILRIFVRDTSASIIVFMSSYTAGVLPYYSYYTSVSGHRDLFFLPPREGLCYITIFSDTRDSSLVTLTPLLMNDINPESIPVNASIAGTLTSPHFFIDKDSNINYRENREEFAFFSASITEGHYYRISVNLDLRSQIGQAGFTSFKQIAGNTSWVSGDTYDHEGYTFKALSNDTWIGVLAVSGDTVDYAIFFQEVSVPEEEEEEAPIILPLNTPTSITNSGDRMFKFTLATPSMVAFNYTGNNPWFYSISHWPDADTSNDIPSGSLTPRYGNLFDQRSYMNSYSNDWLWLPAGDVVFHWGNTGSTEFEVFAIPIQNSLSAPSQFVQSLATPVTLQVNQSSFFALELPMSEFTIYDLVFNDTTHLNQSISYEMGIYTRGEEENIFEDRFELGNYLDNSGRWQDYWWGDGNSTLGYQNFHNWNLSKFVLLVRPFEAYNLTSNGIPDDQQSNFSGQLVVDYRPSNAGPLGTPAGLWIYVPYEYDGGYFIPQNAKVAPGTPEAYNIDDAFTADDEQIFAIPLQTISGTIYNITAHLTGTYAGDTPNVTFTSQLIVSSGNIGDGALWDLIDPESEIYTLGSSIFLANDSTSTLFLGVDRSYQSYYGGRWHYRNATLTISLAAIDAAVLAFEMPDFDYTYNSTPSVKEVKIEEKDKDIDADSPGFGIYMLIAGLSIPALATVLRRHRNKEQ